MRCLFLLFVAVFLVGCASTSKVCKLPPLTEGEVTSVADEYLNTRSMDPEFRKTAQRRVTQRDCLYEYEESEKLDSFGVGVVVVIDRSRKVVDFHSTR